MRGCSLSAWDRCHQAWDRVTLLSEARGSSAGSSILHPKGPGANVTLLVPFAGTSATCWAASPEHTNLPSTAQAAGQAASAAPALHCRCAHRGACGAQPPSPAAGRSSRAKDLASKAGRTIPPSLTCMALLYSSPFFLVHIPCHPAASCKAAGNVISPWRSSSTCCCSQRSTVIPPGAEQIPDRHRVSPRMSIFPD